MIVYHLYHTCCYFSNISSLSEESKHILHIEAVIPELSVLILNI